MDKFYKVYNELMSTKLVDAYSLKVYSVINSFTLTGKNKCFKASNEYLAILTGMNTDTVKKKLKKLREMEWIVSNGHENEHRKLWAVPVLELDELQAEHQKVQVKLKSFRAPKDEVKTPLEILLEKKKSSHTNSGAEAHQQQGDNNGFSLGDTNYNETSKETNDENRTETIKEISRDNSLDKLNETSVSDISPNEDIEVLTIDDVTSDLKYIRTLISEAQANGKDILIAFQQFENETQRKVVGYGNISPSYPKGFFLDFKDPTELLSFERKKFIVIHAEDDLKEIVSHYDV